MARFITPIILLLIAAAIFFGYISPAYKDTKTVRSEIGEYEEALSQSKELQASRDELLTKYNTFEARDLERLKKFLPGNVDNVRLVMDIDSIASKYGMILRNVSIA